MQKNVQIKFFLFKEFLVFLQKVLFHVEFL
jgi:hypothetical protein